MSICVDLFFSSSIELNYHGIYNLITKCNKKVIRHCVNSDEGKV